MANRVKTILALSGIGFLTLWAYSNHFNNAFHFDDMHTIVDNLYIRDIKNIPLFFSDATTTSTLPFNQAYRPGLTTLNTIDFYLSGQKIPTPFTFHVSIFISYLLLGGLCFLLFNWLLNQSLVSKYNLPIALFTTVFFMVHTANAETINYIIARSDSFSTLMIVLSFVLYLYVPKSRKWHLYFLPCIIGFFVKEPTLMFVPLLLVYKLLFEQNLSAKEWFTKFSKTWSGFRQILIPLLISIVIFTISRIYTPVIWQSGGASTVKYLLTQPFVLFHYTYNFILPVNLVIDTDWTMVSSYRDDRVVAGLLFVFGLLYIAYKNSFNAHTRLITFGICWFFIALLPTSSIFPFAEVLNDHRTFFPYIGFFIGLACFFRNLIQEKIFLQQGLGKTAIVSIAASIIIGHSYGTYQRNKVWQTEESIWKDATIKAPNNGRTWMNYGLVFMQQGDFTEALNNFNKTASLLPAYPYVFVNIAIAQSKLGDIITAEMNFKKAISLGNLIPDCYTYYGRFLLEQNRLTDAITILEQGLQLSPKHEVLTNLLDSAKKSSSAALSSNEQNIQDLLASIKKAPTAEKYLDLSLKYYNTGNYPLCINAALEALELKPNYDLAYNNICAANNRLGLWDKAITAAKKGLAINPNNTLIKGNLNEAYAKKK
jgi:protein O-mannosyl-transferase